MPGDHPLLEAEHHLVVGTLQEGCDIESQDGPEIMSNRVPPSVCRCCGHGGRGSSDEFQGAGVRRAMSARSAPRPCQR